jgi:hypothetical protein
VPDVTIVTDKGGANDRTLTFDPATGRLEAETYMDAEGTCCIGFSLTAAQRRTLADLLVTRGDGTQRIPLTASDRDASVPDD